MIEKIQLDKPIVPDTKVQQCSGTLSEGYRSVDAKDETIELVLVE